MDQIAKSGPVFRGSYYLDQAISRRMTSGILLGIGMILCLLALSGLSEKLCLTGGCQVYRGLKLWGLSMHHLGAAAFALGLYWLYKQSPFYFSFIRLCLFAETALLVIQTIYLPCSECLLIALLWGLLGFLSIPRNRIMKVWAVLFLAAMAMLAKEMVKPWPVYGSQESAVKVFFSPSCHHCRDTIVNMMAGGFKGEDVAFIPVALESDDPQRIARFQQVLSSKLNLWQAFQACWGTPEPCSLGFSGWLKLHIGLIRNKMVLARMGAKEVPLVLSKAISFEGPGGGCSFVDEQNNCSHD